MVDLKGQYQKIKSEVDAAIQEVIDNTQFIKGEQVAIFEQNFAQYLGVKHVISCGNGTDALQIALMALDLKKGDEIIVPAFTYVATAEVIGLLGLKPVLIDVDRDTFNINVDLVKAAITSKTKAIIPVHLFGQSTEMEDIINLAKEQGIYIIEDSAQATGAQYTFRDQTKVYAGTMGTFGTTSFFPSKNLGCFGDGGAIFTNDNKLAQKARIIATHGQEKKYHHTILGCNSRLDTLQAAILNVKLKYLDQYTDARNKVADNYDKAFAFIEEVDVPARSKYSTHVFHQYTMKIKNGLRDQLQLYLKSKGIPSGIYYPKPMYAQEAFKDIIPRGLKLENSEYLCKSVLSLPMHTEMEDDTQGYIIKNVKHFFDAN